MINIFDNINVIIANALNGKLKIVKFLSKLK